ncbi:uncharacterized protein GGS22DRAFT_171494 [Annulohypoxylon maeteangense]|uniref:uncharacterized protein n=1 Tax=Annulohypoxylon maeteangense TaxID=1927788 RepID=UPI002007E5EB|nr:uncharacterized protein GGS22DRAFT_171494 [Annulohypoxylon maeteangense]KAI0882089.1 hypothetical protein GGS22DRAFT_171494 [Annulohypoxylon maeteangense]
MVRETYQRMRTRFRPRQQVMPDSSSYVPLRRSPRGAEEPPLAIELLKHPESINPQLSSPIFSKLPSEIREQIWRLSLTRYENLHSIYVISSQHARPGQAGPWRVAVELLLTCRAIYVEAFLKPFQVNPIAVFETNYNSIPLNNPLTRASSNLLLCQKLKSWQFANISSVEMTVQQYVLEGGAIERISRLIGTSGRHKGYESRNYTSTGYAAFVEPTNSDDSNLRVGRKITNLTIRMLRTDWWTWETDPEECRRSVTSRLRLEPMINVTELPARPENSLAMTRGYEARKSGNEPDFGLDDFEKEGRWGMQIGEYWPDLTTLELVLETFGCKQDQLDYVAKCAKLWTFPLPDGYHLAWRGEDAFRWQGAEAYHYEGRFHTWFKEQNKARGTENQDPPLLQWLPADARAADGQEFIVRTIIFERRRDSDR